MRCADDATDRRIDLPQVLRSDLDAAHRTAFEVVAFTHLDNDHICGATEFFELRHSANHQGGGRINIDQMWVPAFVITEDPAECSEEAKLLQAEARHRLKQGNGIRVFSRPEALTTWLTRNDLALSSIRHLITDAGQLVPEFTKEADGVEFFVHSPFALHQDNETFMDRNTNSLVVQATFAVDGADTKVILAADSTHEVLTEIVTITRSKGRDERLEWDVFKLPHHCSYTALSPDRGTDRTIPVPEVAWLFENQAKARGIAISTSKVIPVRGSDADDDQPPHRQAASYHRQASASRQGQFQVTMEHPQAPAPEPLVINIDSFGATLERRSSAIGAAAITRPAPRAG
jgi:hypothetical protein